MYGSIIEQNPPEEIQKLLIGQQPIFLYEGPSPFDKSYKLRALKKVIWNLILVGAVSTAYFVYQSTITEYLLEIQKTVFSDVGSDYYYGLFLLAYFPIAIGISTLFNLYQVLKTTKYWFIGTNQQLIIANNRKTYTFDWNNFQQNPVFIDKFDHSILILKFAKDFSFSVQINNWGSENLNQLELKQFPNTEIKRLIESRLAKASTPDEEFISSF